MIHEHPDLVRIAGQEEGAVFHVAIERVELLYVLGINVEGKSFAGMVEEEGQRAPDILTESVFHAFDLSISEVCNNRAKPI